MPEFSDGANWETFRFDQMAIEVRDRIDNPREATVDRYIGLEHLDAGSLKIRRWGSTHDVEKTKLLFRSGDIVFGRRNAYLRRIAVADFDGVCSAHAMVLRANSKVALPGFLPFFMQTEAFWQAALRNSAGSLSPTINWSNIAKEEFALPPLDEQRRIVDLLQASESVRQQSRTAMEATKTVIASWLHSRLNAITEVHPLGNVLSRSDYGSSAHANTSREGVPMLRIPNVLRGELDLSDLKWVRLSVGETAKYAVRPEDILMVRTNGNPAYVGRCLVVPELPETTVFASYLIRLVVDTSKVRPEYAANVLNSPGIRRLVRRSVRSSAGNFNINTGGIRSVRVPIPSLSEQDSLLAGLNTLTQARGRLDERGRGASAIQRQVIKGLSNEWL